MNDQEQVTEEGGEGRDRGSGVRGGRRKQMTRDPGKTKGKRRGARREQRDKRGGNSRGEEREGRRYAVG